MRRLGFAKAIEADQRELFWGPYVLCPGLGAIVLSC